jgi:hypothetical protein
MKTTEFKFELGQDVEMAKSRERGTVIGRAEYNNSPASYYVLYLAADGRQVKDWWNAEDMKAPVA